MFYIKTARLLFPLKQFYPHFIRQQIVLGILLIGIIFFKHLGGRNAFSYNANVKNDKLMNGENYF